MAKKAAKKAAARRNAADIEDLDDLEDLEDLGRLDDLPDLPPLPPLEAAEGTPAIAPRSAAARGERFLTNARDGLRLRAGPDTSFAVLRTLPFSTPVQVIGREGLWSQVDLEGDGAADGFMLSSLLRPASAALAAAAGPDITERVTSQLVASIFPRQTPRANIDTHLPFVLAGLRVHALADKPMVLMALGTIRAETEGFAPISEFRSRFNTRNTPFDLYDAGTSIGRRLGNTVAGDGPRFKGRGFVQLTGRSNYTKIGAQLGQPLVTNPDLANDPAVAGLILAAFLKNQERRVRAALAANDLRAARKAVNGGSHGLERFVDTFRRGSAALQA